MAPALEIGDHFTTIEVKSERLNPIERFNIVVYKPQPVKNYDIDLNSKFTARVIGLGGEKIEIKKGKVFINGKLLDEPFERFEDDFNFPPVVIPQGEFFLLGDNRPNSLDSRYWKNPTIKAGDIYGKVNTIIRKEDWDKGKRW
jgi:signal peptidase I